MTCQPAPIRVHGRQPPRPSPGEPEGAVPSEPTVRAAGPAEREHWIRGEDVVLRGRGDLIRTWVRR